MQKILILMSETGGGHRASAEALKEGFLHYFPGQVQVEIVDLLMQHLPGPLNLLPKSYTFLANQAPQVWKWLWNLTADVAFSRWLMSTVARLSRKPVQLLFQKANPDLIISVHPLVQELTLDTLQFMGEKKPFVTVVTDLATAHPLWFHPGVDLCFIASKATLPRALQAGLQPAQIREFGLPIRLAFSEPTVSRRLLREKLAMQPDLPTALLIGGGDGIGKLEEIAKHISAALANGENPAGQLVVICGKNQALKARLAHIAWPIPTIINGYVANIIEWMACSDCIVTKAGPGTIAEALSQGLPLILSGYIPGQEEGNISYITEANAGVYEPGATEIAETIKKWFNPTNNHLQAMGQNARRLSQPKATSDIVHEIANYLAGMIREN